MSKILEKLAFLAWTVPSGAWLIYYTLTVIGAL